MRISPSVFLLMISLGLSQWSVSQTSLDTAVPLTAEVNPNSPSITIEWGDENLSGTYTIWKRVMDWDEPWVELASLTEAETSYNDTDVLTNQVYEYSVRRNSSPLGFGYITAGIEVDESHSRGRILIVVDTTYISDFESELNRTLQDLEGDGWKVDLLEVSPDDEVTEVKSRIVTSYDTDPENTRSAFLFGHVPVPYSGEIYPDGHPDHEGAWAADTYYADMDGEWTDQWVNNTVAAGSVNDNIPGDGKFDQSFIPSDLELEIGRVDFSNITVFGVTEGELLRRYLDKNHDYRHKVFTPRKRALIDDNFGFFSGEAFGGNGWKNFPTLVGRDSILNHDYDGYMGSASYQWSYGCGAGSTSSCAGVVTSGGFASNEIQSVFTFLFGSYFGDWNAPENLMRTSLGSGTVLTCAWAGRPHWQFHHMAMGHTIGYSARLSQINQSSYHFNYGGRFVHTALLGDPSLRADVVAPASDLSTQYGSDQNTLNWVPSSDEVLGYHIYRKDQSAETFTQINTQIVTSTSFTDYTSLNFGQTIYMVRAVKLEESFSGSYYNLSQGVFDTLQVTMGVTSNNALRARFYPNPTTGYARIDLRSQTFGNANLQIMDLKGKLLSEFELTESSIELDLKDLSTGLYLIKIEADGVQFQSKFSKLD